mgnify:CR=1 FL=1
MMTFSAEVRDAYRIVTTRYGLGESEETIPLGSWRKGDGLAGKRGHVYLHGPNTAGIWLIGGRLDGKVDALHRLCPELAMMQRGFREMTLKCPISSLPHLLPALNAKRLKKLSDVARTQASVALVEARKRRNAK